MELKIKVRTNDSCQVTIFDETEYWESENISKGNFTYSDTVSVDVLQWNGTQETTYEDPVFTVHEDQDDPVTIDVEKDGWFTVAHLVLPSQDWFENAADSTLELYSIVYYTDGETIYKYVDGETSEVEAEEIMEVNTTDTTLSRTTEDYVSICYLIQCFINYCKQIFENSAFTTCWNKNEDDETAYKRDLVWMAICVIKYLVKCGQLYEAQRYIEQMDGCNGLCPSDDDTSTTSGCGCRKSS